MSGNRVVGEAVRLLGERLPPGWRLLIAPTEGRKSSADAELRLIGPDRKASRLWVETKSSLSPKGAVQLLNQRGDSGAAQLIVAPYLSPAVRERLRAAGRSYLDLTGNAFVAISRPGIFIETQGASVNPARSTDGDRSLRGATAGRIVRALLETRQPTGVRDLATRTSANPGYVSRLLAWMDREALVERQGRGELVSVDWQRLLRRWANDAPLESRGRQLTCLAPRGLGDLTQRLLRYRGRYALTGSLASAQWAPVAPAKLALLYLDQPEQSLDRLDLRPAEAGANVILIEPTDEAVYSGVKRVRGLTYVAANQAAADLLSSPGRGPAEAEALIEWMATHEDAWRG